MTEPLTKSDLRDFQEDIKSHITDKLAPIHTTQKMQHTTLYGKEGRNGLVGDVNDMKSTGRNIKWIASLGGGSGFLAFMASWFKSGG